jgi:hypothetical protein
MCESAFKGLITSVQGVFPLQVLRPNCCITPISANERCAIITSRSYVHPINNGVNKSWSFSLWCSPQFLAASFLVCPNNLFCTLFSNTVPLIHVALMQDTSFTPIQNQSKQKIKFCVFYPFKAGIKS